MPFTVSYDRATDCVLGRIEGVVDSALLEDYASQLVKTVAESRCPRVFGDYRGADVQVTTVELFALPDKLTAIASELGATALWAEVRRAIVADPDQQQTEFYVTVARNRAHSVKLFDDPEEARAWLLAVDRHGASRARAPADDAPGWLSRLRALLSR